MLFLCVWGGRGGGWFCSLSEDQPTEASSRRSWLVTAAAQRAHPPRHHTPFAHPAQSTPAHQPLAHPPCLLQWWEPSQSAAAAHYAGPFLTHAHLRAVHVRPSYHCSLAAIAKPGSSCVSAAVTAAAPCHCCCRQWHGARCACSARCASAAPAALITAAAGHSQLHLGHLHLDGVGLNDICLLQQAAHSV